MIRVGPEKGVIHIATGAVDNALWDLYARSRKKPLWKLVVDMTPVRKSPHLCPVYSVDVSMVMCVQEELVNSAAFRYISDAITKEEALEMLKAKEAGKKERETNVRELGSVNSLNVFVSLLIVCLFCLRYPAYVTSAGWMGLSSISQIMSSYSYSSRRILIVGYSDEKVERLTKEAVSAGFNHFKMKVGADRDSDLRRGKIIRKIIDDPQYLPPGRKPIDPSHPSLVGKNAGPTGSVFMIDANQVWDVKQAIEWTSSLAELKPWYVLGFPY